MQKWGKPDNVVAQKLSKDQIPGVFKKEIFLGNDEVAVVGKNGKIIEELSAGKHAVKGDFTDVILVDTKTKMLKKLVQGLITEDDQEVACEIEMRFGIYYVEKFVRNLFSGKVTLTLDDVFSELEDELITKVLEPVIKETSIDDLYGNRELIDRIQIGFEVELKKLLEIWGVELISFNLIWKLPEDYKQYLKSRSSNAVASKEKKKQREVDLEQAVEEKEIEAVKKRGKTTEEVKSDLEKEYMHKELLQQLEKEESAEDLEEALAGMQLKDVMKKEKIKRKKQAKEEDADDSEDAEEPKEGNSEEVVVENDSEEADDSGEGNNQDKKSRYTE